MRAVITMQTKKDSLIESLANIAIGLTIALVSQVAFFYFSDIKITLLQNISLVFWMTFISLVRSYSIRRWFNNKTRKLK